MRVLQLSTPTCSTLGTHADPSGAELLFRIADVRALQCVQCACGDDMGTAEGRPRHPTTHGTTHEASRPPLPPPCSISSPKRFPYLLTPASQCSACWPPWALPGAPRISPPNLHATQVIPLESTRRDLFNHGNPNPRAPSGLELALNEVPLGDFCPRLHTMGRKACTKALSRQGRAGDECMGL